MCVYVSVRARTRNVDKILFIYVRETCFEQFMFTSYVHLQSTRFLLLVIRLFECFRWVWNVFHLLNNVSCFVFVYIYRFVNSQTKIHKNQTCVCLLYVFAACCIHLVVFSGFRMRRLWLWGINSCSAVYVRNSNNLNRGVKNPEEIISICRIYAECSTNLTVNNDTSMKNQYWIDCCLLVA